MIKNSNFHIFHRRKSHDASSKSRNNLFFSNISKVVVILYDSYISFSPPMQPHRKARNRLPGRYLEKIRFLHYFGFQYIYVFKKCLRFEIFRILDNIWKIEFWTILIKKQNNHVPLRPLSDQLRTIELKFFILQSNPH